jgi:hypothetical protein
MHFHWSRAGPTLEAVMCITVERWPKTVHTIASGQFCTERRKQQARLVACGSNTPPRPPLEQQPGVVVMHLRDRLRVRTRVDCTAPSTESEVCTERRKQQARWVACGSNTPPRPPLEQQPGVVVMHLHDRLRVRARIGCTAPSTEGEHSC